MPPIAIFRVQLALGLLVWTLFVVNYWWPALRALDRRQALRSIAMLNAFRFEGLLFLMPAFIGPNLPAAFAIPAAYGDFATSLLAIASILTYRWERVTLILTVLYTALGATDLINNVYRTIALNIDSASFGVTYLIPILYVPLLLLMHGFTLWPLLRPQTAPARKLSAEMQPSASTPAI
jgi:hypothetical protein